MIEILKCKRYPAFLRSCGFVCALIESTCGSFIMVGSVSSVSFWSLLLTFTDSLLSSLSRWSESSLRSIFSSSVVSAPKSALVLHQSNNQTGSFLLWVGSWHLQPYLWLVSYSNSWKRTLLKWTLLIKDPQHFLGFSHSNSIIHHHSRIIFSSRLISVLVLWLLRLHSRYFSTKPTISDRDRWVN